MLNMLKSFIKEEDGLGTVEIILIIAVLVGIALIFRTTIINFVNNIINKIFPSSENVENNKDLGKANPKLQTGSN